MGGARALALAGLVAGCDRGASCAGAPTGTLASLNSSAEEAEAPEATSTEPAPGEPAMDDSEEGIDPALACGGPGECTRTYLATAPQTDADCVCRTCATHVVSLTGLAQRSQADQRVCGAWYRTHDCPPVTCAAEDHRALCVRGMCVAAPVVSSDEPSPCRSPRDCPRGAACVTSALGGDIGCTNETCCGASECHNGCATDADCPSCRPSCVSGSCRNPNGAM